MLCGPVSTDAIVGGEMEAGGPVFRFWELRIMSRISYSVLDDLRILCLKLSCIRLPRLKMSRMAAQRCLCSKATEKRNKVKRLMKYYVNC